MIAVIVPMMPIGRFTKKIHRQSVASRITPPRMGPAMMPSDTVVPLMPSALPRSEGGNASVVIAKPRAKIMAAPRACTTLAAMRNPIVGESPASTEPNVKTANPAVKMGFLPIMSPSRPKPSVKVAWVSR